jgi:hypothetical protein
MATARIATTTPSTPIATWTPENYSRRPWKKTKPM